MDGEDVNDELTMAESKEVDKYIMLKLNSVQYATFYQADTLQAASRQ